MCPILAIATYLFMHRKVTAPDYNLGFLLFTQTLLYSLRAQSWFVARWCYFKVQNLASVANGRQRRNTGDVKMEFQERPVEN